MPVTLTAQQARVVATDGNVAVTAGAGTGKTSAMTERVVRVLDGLERIDQLLVVTFTDDAAGEIRRRVYQALLARIRQSDGDERDRLEAMRDGFLQNHISTMHTFFAHVLRRFPDRLEGVDPDFRVISGAEQQALLRDSVEGVIDRIASSPRAPMRDDLRRWLRQQRRAGVCAAITVLIRKRIEVDAWLRRMAEEPGAMFEATARRAQEFMRRAREAFFSHDALLDLVAALRAAAPLPGGDRDKLALKRAATLNGLAQQDLPALRLALLTKAGKVSIRKLGAEKAWDEETRDHAHVVMVAIAERLVADPSLTFEWDGSLEEDAHEALASLARLTGTCVEEYRRRKERLGALDFVDLEECAAALFRDPGVLAALRRQFRAIFIDEFQDTNRHQWAMFRALADDGAGALRPDVLSVVGDEKQAIYEFRGGEVEVCGLARRELDHNLEFTANFRSAPNLILFTNRFFASLLTGDRPYEAQAQMLTHGDISEPPAASVERGGSVTRIVDLVGEASDATDDGEEAAEDQGTVYEREARAIAQLLQGVTRGERESDFPGLAASIEAGDRSVGILFRRTTHQHTYEDALRAHGVPYIAARGRGFFRSEEARDLRNLMRLMQDVDQDIPLVGALRSPIVGCSDSGLLLLATRRAYPYQRLWDVLLALPDDASMDEAGFSSDDLHALRKAPDMLRRWRAASRREPVSAVLSRALVESGAYAPYALGVDGRQRVLNVEKFLGIVAALEADGARTLGDLTRHIDMQDEEGDAEGDADMPEGGAIQLLTVHRAKGLEWPMVIVPDTDAGFRPNIDETAGPAGSSRATRLAIGRDPDGANDDPATVAIRYKTAYHDVAKTFTWRRMEEDRRRRGRAEQKRLLYVAFTRAQRHLIVGCCTDRRSRSEDLDDATSWADWIRHVLEDGSVCRQDAAFYREIHPPSALDSGGTAYRAAAAPEIDPSRLWDAPPATPGVDAYGLGTVADAAGDGVARRAGAPANVVALTARQLLPSAWQAPDDVNALRGRAEGLLTAYAGGADRAALADAAVAAARHASEWLAARFPPPHRLLFNRAFDVRANGERLVGAADVVAIDDVAAWTVVEVDYALDGQPLDGEAWDARAQTLKEAVGVISDGRVVDVVRCVVPAGSN